MKNASLRKIIFAALMAALTTVATMIIRIPTPTQGYIHLGGMVLLLGLMALVMYNDIAKLITG